VTAATPSYSKDSMPPRADAWRLARYLAGAPFTDIARLLHPVAKGAAVAMERSNGEGRDGALEAYFWTLDAAVADLWKLSIMHEDPESDEPADAPPIARYTLHSAAEIDLPLPPREDVVDEIIVRGDVVAFVGDAGSKKTLSLTDLSVSVANNEEEWCGFTVRGGPVFFTDEESGRRRFLQRLGDTMRAHHAPSSIPLKFTSLENFDLRVPEDVAALEEILAAERPALWVIDALMDVLAGADENAAKDLVPALRTLRRLAVTYNVAIVLIHHAGKDGKGYRGSSAIKGQVDAMIMVESKPDSPNIDFASEKVRDSAPLRFAVAAHFGEGHFHLSRTGQEKPRAKLSAGEQEVLRYLEAQGGRAFREAICYGVESVSAGTAKNAITSLVKRSLIHRCNEGAKGADAEYALGAKPEVTPW
jgi:hypothetical protein